MLFVQYPPCSTCQKAKKWLLEQGLSPTMRHIVDEAPTEVELRAWIARSGLPLKRWFNTSGVLYRELGLSAKLPTMSEDEQLALLASDGKLIKRPILVTDSHVLIGFKAELWADALSK